MVASCAAYNCTERHVKGTKLSFHSFPTDPEVRKQWVLNMRRKDFEPSSSSRLCSKHFEPNCYDKNRFGPPCLIKGSLPTIFQFPDHLMRKTNPRNPPKNRDDPCDSSTLSDSITELPASTELTASTENASDSGIMISRPTGDSHQLSRKHYVGDFTEDDMMSPEKAKKCLSLAQSTISSQRCQLRNLRGQNKRLRKKVASLKSIVKYLQKECMINRNAAEGMKDEACSEASQSCSETREMEVEDFLESELETHSLSPSDIPPQTPSASCGKGNRNFSSSLANSPTSKLATVSSVVEEKDEVAADEHDVFGQYVASECRGIEDPIELLSLRKKITDLIYETKRTILEREKASRTIYQAIIYQTEDGHVLNDNEINDFLNRSKK